MTGKHIKNKHLMDSILWDLTVIRSYKSLITTIPLNIKKITICLQLLWSSIWYLSYLAKRISYIHFYPNSMEPIFQNPYSLDLFWNLVLWFKLFSIKFSQSFYRSCVMEMFQPSCWYFVNLTTLIFSGWVHCLIFA